MILILSKVFLVQTHCILHDLTIGSTKLHHYESQTTGTCPTLFNGVLRLILLWTYFNWATLKTLFVATKPVATTMAQRTPLTTLFPHLKHKLPTEHSGDIDDPWLCPMTFTIGLLVTARYVFGRSVRVWGAVFLEILNNTAHRTTTLSPLITAPR